MSRNDANKSHGENMRKILDLIRFFDEGRWSSCYHYDIPNYADREMPLDQKWLTHFLGYVTNRLTKYSMIFAKLDFIFSQLVIDYQKHSAYFLLFQPGPYLNFQEGKFCASRPMDEHAQYAGNESFSPEEKISAASRCFSSDVAAIFCTLKLLTHFSEKSIARYMNLFLKRAEEGKELESLLYGLWLLGYSDIGLWKKENLNHQDVFDRCFSPKKAAIEKYLSENGGIPDDFREQRFHIKRLTCFVRDLLKCDHFFDHEGICIPLDMLETLKRQLYVLELPGDVWNNNEHFRKCFSLRSGMERPKNGAFNKRIRKFYEEHAWKELGLSPLEYYPEQLDATFDFVPRMCEKTGQANCSFCPVKHATGRIPKEFCVGKNDQETFCPFLLYACGYKVRCKDMESCPNKR